MNDKKAVILPPTATGGHLLPDRIWTDEDLDAIQPTDSYNGGFTSLTYLRAAVRRGFRLWCVTGLVGLLVASALYVLYPPTYQATASVLVTNNPNEDPVAAMETDVVLAESRPVASLVARRLGLTEGVSGLLAAYTVTVVTDQVLLFTVNAPSAAGAVGRANALATGFLQFRASLLRFQQQPVRSSLNSEIATDQQDIASLDAQMVRLAAEPATTDRQARLKTLQTQRTNDAAALSSLQQTVAGDLATAQQTTATMVGGSSVLNPATLVHRSRIKGAAAYVAVGLFGGLALGIGIVVVAALITDKLRRRDDVAYALGVPVRLSVTGPGARRPWRPVRGLGRRPVLAEADVRRVSAHLATAVPVTAGGLAALTVVAVDNAGEAALPFAELASSRARKGRRVVVADLTPGAPAAVRLGAATGEGGAAEPGVHSVRTDGTELVVAVPDPDAVVPDGPLGRGGVADKKLRAACASADLLLTLATLDPALGGEHLASWAPEAVAVVTAGHSSASRLRGVAELVRLGGVRLASAVLLGADRSDESLGVPSRPGVGAGAR